MINGWFESLLMGAASGLTDILPVSLLAHRQLLLKMIGTNRIPPIMREILKTMFAPGMAFILEDLRASVTKDNGKRICRGATDIKRGTISPPMTDSGAKVLYTEKV